MGEKVELFCLNRARRYITHLRVMPVRTSARAAEAWDFLPTLHNEVSCRQMTCSEPAGSDFLELGNAYRAFLYCPWATRAEDTTGWRIDRAGNVAG